MLALSAQKNRDLPLKPPPSGRAPSQSLMPVHGQYSNRVLDRLGLLIVAADISRDLLGQIFDRGEHSMNDGVPLDF